MKIIAKLAVKGHFIILWETIYVSITFDSLDRLTVNRDRPKRLFLVTAVTETGAEIQLLVSAVTVTETETIITILLTVKVTMTVIQATN